MDPRQMQNYGPMTPPGYPGGMQTNTNSYSQTGYPSLSQQMGNQNQNTMSGAIGNVYGGQVAMMPGRMVDDESDIVAQEVPMDGRIAAFPRRDLTVVYLKQWNNRGTIDTLPYVLDKKQNNQESSNDEFRTEILSRLDRLEALIKGPKNTSSRKKPTQNASEEEESE